MIATPETHVVIGIKLTKVRDVQRGNTYMADTDFVSTKVMLHEDAQVVWEKLRKIKPTNYLYFVVPVGH